MTILFILLSIVIFGFIFIFSLIKGISTLLFGKSNGVFYQNQYQDTNTGNNHANGKQHSKKIFSKDEGEYIGYEEIKDRT